MAVWRQTASRSAAAVRERSSRAAVPSGRPGVMPSTEKELDGPAVSTVSQCLSAAAVLRRPWGLCSRAASSSGVRESAGGSRVPVARASQSRMSRVTATPSTPAWQPTTTSRWTSSPSVSRVKRSRGAAVRSNGTATSARPSSSARASIAAPPRSPTGTRVTVNSPSVRTSWRSGKPSAPGPGGKTVRSDSCRSSSARRASTAVATVVPSGTGQTDSRLICSGRSRPMQRSMLSWPRVSGPEPPPTPWKRAVIRPSVSVTSCVITSIAPFGSQVWARCGRDATSGPIMWSRPETWDTGGPRQYSDVSSSTCHGKLIGDQIRRRTSAGPTRRWRPRPGTHRGRARPRPGRGPGRARRGRRAAPATVRPAAARSPGPAARRTP